MNPSNRRSTASRTIAISVDAPSRTRPSGHAAVALRHAGESERQLRREKRSVLRRRLTMAALSLLMGFAAFLVWHWFNLRAVTASYVILFVAHFMVTLILAAAAAVLCSKYEMPQRVLRILELVIFSLPAMFLFYWHYVYTRTYALGYDLLPMTDGMWLMLLFIYALFVPNTWQRASLVIGTFAALPVVLTILLLAFDEDCQAASNADLAFVSQLVLKMLFGAASSVLAVHTIGQLRREVFEARQLGQYKLGRRIGGGGMGEVYLAEHQLLRRPCAIKVIRPAKAGDPTVLARFEREVCNSARLSHWNNIDIYDYGRTDDGTFYYVMEYLPGMSLMDLVRRFGALPAERVVYLLRQICEALGEAHGIGLIHRDIKPANIIASERGGVFDVAKLLDFGLVKPPTDSESSQITQDGKISGSPLYMSPEQVTADQPADARSDIYSVGAVGYFLLSGQPPFDDDNPMKVMIAHVNDPPRRPSELQPDVPEDLESIILRCLAKDPDSRFQSAVELRDALDACRCAGMWTRQKAAQWWSSNGHCEGVAEAQEVASVG